MTNGVEHLFKTDEDREAEEVVVSKPEKKSAPSKTGKSDTSTLSIPLIEIQDYILRIRGLSPLIIHAWSSKAKEMMLKKQQGVPMPKKERRDPEADYQGGFYRLEDGTPAFPAIAFKAAAVSAATQIDGLTKVFLRGAFHTIDELVAINGEPRMREDMVRIGMGTADLRYRPEFPEWDVDLRIRLNSRVITIQQIAHLFNQAGFSVGVGEWRPEKDGSNGMFHVYEYITLTERA